MAADLLEGDDGNDYLSTGESQDIALGGAGEDTVRNDSTHIFLTSSTAAPASTR